jgi:capsid assembly protease
MTTPLSSLLTRPLALSEIGAAHLRGLALNAAHYERFAVASKEAAEKPDWMEYDYLGNKIAQPTQREDGTRVIPLQGAVTRNLGLLGQFLGMADTDRFAGWVRDAANDPTVSRIALHIQSPGGDAIGCYEAAQAVAQAAKKKTVVAFCDDMMASAAYFIGAGATAIAATPSSLIGSIGTYVVLADDSEAWKRAGVEFRVVRSGKFKGAGIDGYTEEQVENVQRMVDSFGAQFRSFVKKHRGSIAAENMGGQVFLGAEAVSIGFVDTVENTLDSALARIQKALQQRGTAS